MLFFRYLFPYALGLGIATGLALAGYMLSGALLTALVALSTEARATILAALATPIVAIITVALTHCFSRRREIAAAQRVRKIVFYEEFLEEYFGFLSALSGKGSAEKAKTAKDLRQKMIEHGAKTARKLMLWGGKDTIAAYLEMRKLASSGQGEGTSSFEIIWKFDELLAAIRAELGHPRRSIARGELLKLFINDIDDHLGRDRT